MFYMDPGFLPDHLFEIGVSVFLAVLGWSFKNWSGAIERTSKEVLGKLDKVYQEFHNHRIEVEHRVTKVEAQIEKDRDA